MAAVTGPDSPEAHLPLRPVTSLKIKNQFVTGTATAHLDHTTAEVVLGKE